MRNWRFAVTRRWFGYLAFAVVFAIACGFLSNWQVARSREAAAANALVARNFDAPSRPLAEVLSTRTGWSAGDEWSRVTMTGRYERSDELLARNRPTDAGPGFEVLTPLRLADGSVFIVDRGWVPTGDDHDRPDAVPSAPAGEVTLTARLKQSEPELYGRTATGDQVATIDLPQIRSRLGEPALYTGGYGLLQSQSPAAETPLAPLVTAPPTADEGLHWSYAIQWVIFALIGFFGLGYALRKEYRMRNADDPDEQRRAADRERRRAARRTDSDVEDELVDAAVPR